MRRCWSAHSGDINKIPKTFDRTRPYLDNTFFELWFPDLLRLPTSTISVFPDLFRNMIIYDAARMKSVEVGEA